MKLKRITLLLTGILFTVSAQAQFEDFLKGGVDDANVLFNHYMSPFMKGMGYGFNNG